MVALSIEGIECRYTSVKILEDVTFQVKSGDFIGVLGPNGAGKTTLLKTISGILKPRSGVVYIDNKDVNQLKVKEIAKTIAVVPQDSQSAFNFSVMDIVLMGRNPHMGRFQLESPRDIQVALNSMKLAGIDRLADRSLDEMSGGERRMVLIARALAQEPRILLLDEPTLHLDVNNQITMMELLHSLCRRNGLLIVAVLHDFNLAARYCDKLILIGGSKIQAVGKPEEALTKENIATVFGVQVYIKRHEITNSLYITPVSASPRIGKKNLKVHVICGGGSGAYLLKTLSEQGYDLSAGVLNILDTDHDVASQLEIKIAVEAPFSPMTQASYNKNLRLIQRSDIVIVSKFMVGKGNLRNLEAAIEGIRMGKPLVLIDLLGSRYDYTDGEGERLIDILKNEGAIVTSSQDEALNLVKKLYKKLRNNQEANVSSTS